MGVRRLERLDPREYEHPSDQKALDALEKTKGLDVLVRKFYDLGLERAFRIRYTGSNLRATPSSFPALYELLEEACDVLNLQQVPEFYIDRGDLLQGVTVGVDHPIVVVSTSCVELLDAAELRFILGREIGHVKSQHVLYREMGALLPVVSDALAAATMGLSSLVTVGLQLALVHWYRMSELTADRAGLLCCQDITVATKALAKIAGLPAEYFDRFNLDDFVTQVREFEGYDERLYDRILKLSGAFFEGQLWAVMRAQELLAWTESGQYKAVLDRETEIGLAPQVNFCPRCGTRIEAPASFCPQCGASLTD